MVLIAAGVVGSLLGGFIATQWQKGTPAGYALLLCFSIFVTVPLSFCALLAESTSLSMAFLAGSIFLIFFSTGPVNTLIIEAVPANLRSSAMAMSIFMIHLFGDMYSPEVIGRTADRMGGDLRKAILVLPASLLVAAFLWLLLALKQRGKDPCVAKSAGP